MVYTSPKPNVRKFGFRMARIPDGPVLESPLYHFIEKILNMVYASLAMANHSKTELEIERSQNGIIFYKRKYFFELNIYITV
jgi:hypothetical protein